jgi:hypothetical protein
MQVIASYPCKTKPRKLLHFIGNEGKSVIDESKIIKLIGLLEQKFPRKNCLGD